MATPEDAKAAGKKPPPAKAAAKGATAVLEEITDNRPREIQYIKNYAEEAKAIRVTDDVAKFIEGFQMKLEIFLVDRETQAETMCEFFNLDLSPLLYESQANGEITWKFDKMMTMQLHYLNVSVSFDLPPLNVFMRNKLNPLLVNLVACKDIPYKTEPEFKPIYALFKFVDGRTFKT